MRFHADLHVHSKYSRATSRDLDLEHLAWWAARKGIGVVATGDFVHPGWLAEIKEKLVPAEPGLFRLRPEIEDAVAAKLPPACRSAVRFMLEVEISTIYKKGDRTRKIHHLIYAAELGTVDRIAARLARIGNIASDGRPILGLDSRDLLEIALESGPDAYLVPAHIWTPWFAALGSQSGFDSIAECYGDLADHIFAVETGLSSDPPMNWRVSFLDSYRLTSSSDAHSPGKLGREATLFDCEPDYYSLRRALETGKGYGGTVEFFPEEGKYHQDGHRKCEVRLTPKETLAHGGRCPVCGGAVTIGVAHRVAMLADREEGETVAPPTAGAVANLVPLPEMLAESLECGRASKAVERDYDLALARLGPELAILQDVPVEDISLAGSPLLAEAVSRLRAGQVIREAGYDGEYGVIRLFEPGELKRLAGGRSLFEEAVVKKVRPAQEGWSGRPAETTNLPHAEVPDEGGPRSTANGVSSAFWTILRGRPDCVGPAPQDEGRTQANAVTLGAAGKAEATPASVEASPLLTGLDPDQRRAVETIDGPLLIVAGPGSGKTRTLTHRIAHIVSERGVPAENCLAITFTRRAAAEMHERLGRLLASRAGDLPIHTFHSLGLAILREHALTAGLRPGFRIASEAERASLLANALGISASKAESLLRAISKAKRDPAGSAEIAGEMADYARAMAEKSWIDFDDLVRLAAGTLANDAALAGSWRERFRFISVDEFQDVDAEQYRLLRLIAPPGANLAVIGDPDQAIYGFRGADAGVFERFRQDYPTAVAMQLKRNYRSTGTIVAASSQMISGAGGDAPLAAIVRGMHERISIHAAPTERAEAEHVVATIEELIGGHSFFSIDSGRAQSGRSELGFADFAVLYRTEAQSAALAEALARSGMPFKTSSHARLTDDPAVRTLLAEIDREPGEATVAARLRMAAERLRASGAPALAWAEALRRLSLLAEGADYGRFLERVALANEADFFDPRADRISLVTMHAAKGLEFAVVFVVGLEDGLMPLRFGGRDANSEAEERRLLYVAMTRAKDRLFLSRAAERHWRGKSRRLDASPFLADIENELVRYQQPELPRRRAADTQLNLF